MTGDREGTSVKRSSLLRRTRSEPAAFWTAVSSIAACLAVLFAAWAAFATQKSAEEASRATRANVWMQLMDQYSSPEMLAAMKELRGWQQQHPKTFAHDFEVLLTKPSRSPEDERLANTLDLDRRRISHFFAKLQILCQGQIIDEDFLAAEWSTSSYNYIVEVLIPMEGAKTQAMLETNGINREQKIASDKQSEEFRKFFEKIANMPTNAYQRSAH